MFKICNFGLIYLKRLLYACIFCVAIIFFRIVSVFTVNRKKTPKKQQQQKMIFFYTGSKATIHDIERQKRRKWISEGRPRGMCHESYI